MSTKKTKKAVKKSTKKAVKRVSVADLLNSTKKHEVVLGVIYRLAKSARASTDVKKEKSQVSRRMNIIKKGFDDKGNKVDADKYIKMLKPYAKDVIPKEGKKGLKVHREILNKIYDDFKTEYSNSGSAKKDPYKDSKASELFGL